MKPIIEVENLSKLYHVGTVRLKSLKQVAEQWWYGITRTRPPVITSSQVREFSAAERGPVPNSFWALKDVSFTVNAGEVIGVIGRNGAGKSTLLKVLSRITEPTSGRAILRGRVASLLEVGTGFHPDLTGRENVYMNGAILGMRKREIDKKFDEIVTFSEVEKFIDTPVKHYSSGMYVRLAFAVAAHLDPEILFVDEVLAVGDAAFQKKCMGKMGEVAKQGRTVLFVSHNMGAIKGLCRRGLLLEQGRVVSDDNVHNVISAYLALGQIKVKDGLIPDSFPRSGTGEMKVRRIELCNALGKSIDQVCLGQSFRAVMTIEVIKEVPDMVLGLHLSSHDSVCFASCYNTDKDQRPYNFKKGWYRVEIDLATVLVPQQYAINAALFRSNGSDVDLLENIFSFEALNVSENSKDSYPWTTRHGYIRPEAKWHEPQICSPSPKEREL